MKYMGSKNRIAKHILPIILADRKDGQCYVEPFAGGLNSMDKVTCFRLAGEINEYISEMWNALINGWKPPVIDKEIYKAIKNNKGMFDKAVVGWVGICCSYSGKWFGGFAGKVETKGGLRDYQAEALKNVMLQIDNLKGLQVICSSYDDLSIPSNSIIYCDPPYAGTTKYKEHFNHNKFWQWCRDKRAEGHQVFISEYKAPDDFICVWEKPVKSSLSANGKYGCSKLSVEKLFIHESQINSSDM